MYILVVTASVYGYVCIEQYVVSSKDNSHHYYIDNALDIIYIIIVVLFLDWTF
jgi:hypothetical protein